MDTRSARGRMRLWDESAMELFRALRAHRHGLIVERAIAEGDEKRKLQRRVTVTDRLMDELERTQVEMGWPVLHDMARGPYEPK